MDTTTEVVVGQVVKSKAGRDKDKKFVIIDIVDEQYVLVADGDLRKLDKPKKKKIRHLAKYNTICEEVKNRLQSGEKVTNLLLRRELEKLGL